MKTDDQVIAKLMRRHAALLRARAVVEAEPLMESSHGEHLDADELSAFAENALTPTARSRYISHLADCERCRRIMVAVSTATTSAAAVAKDREPAAHVGGDASPGWRRYLQSLFSFPTLRFALPVLAFLTIAGVVWRVYEPTPRSNSSVSDRKITAPAIEVSPGSTVGEQAAANNPPSTRLGAEPGNEAKRAAAERAAPKTATDQSAANAGEPLSLPSLSPPSPPATQNKSSEDAQEEQQTDSRAQQAYQSNDIEDPKTRTAKEKPADDVKREDEAVASGERVSTAEETRSAAVAAPSRSRSAARSSPASQGVPPSPRKEKQAEKGEESGGGAASGAAAAAKQDIENDASSQSVAGRTFRRQGAAWIDTAYRNSQSVTTVSRSSEQYRALVADEPSLRAIAERLSGEVVVVWKNRVYRFR